MVKKVVVSALVIGLSAVLILGAVRRTQDKTSTDSEGGHGRGQSAESVQNEDGERTRNGQQGADGDRVEAGSAGDTDVTTFFQACECSWVQSNTR